MGIKVTAASVAETVEQHPDFPSLLSISESLTKWNVENIALKVKSESLEHIPTPFIAHSKKGKGNFVLVQAVNGSVEYIDQNGRSKYKGKEEFIKEWSNVVLLAESNDRSGEQLYKVNRQKEILRNVRIPFLLLMCVGLIAFFSMIVPGISPILLLATKFSGCIVSGLLLWFEIDKENPALLQICTAGKNTNCAAVLSSKAATLFNFVSWSEIGFLYFAGGFLFLLLNIETAVPAYRLLTWMNLFVLPYTVFSVFYQWRIAKQWCPLCLFVQALLILEFINGYYGYWSSDHLLEIDHVLVFKFLLAFLLPLFFWVASKFAYKQARNTKDYKKDLARMTYNRDVLDVLLSREKAITNSTEGLGITLGNPQAKNTIVKVCNPYCGPCSKAHPVIDEILALKPDVKVQIIFSGIKANNDSDKITKVVKHLMALYERNDPALIAHALDDWYVNFKKDYDRFASKYPVHEYSKTVDSKLQEMREWDEKTEIAYTPTFFVNGHQLPDLYKLEHLKHIL